MIISRGRFHKADLLFIKEPIFFLKGAAPPVGQLSGNLQSISIPDFSVNPSNLGL